MAVQACLGKWFARPYLKKTHHKKKTGEVVQGIGPEFRPNTMKKKSLLHLIIIYNYNLSKMKLNEFFPNKNLKYKKEISVVFLYTNDVLAHNESKEIIPFTIASKRIKY
jgi:hypothetical protein